MLTTRQIDSKAHTLGITNYIGTFALDEVPHIPMSYRDNMRPGGGGGGDYVEHFIVNTQTKNLPGQHWVAVSIAPHRGVALIFDSLGMPPARQLIRNIQRAWRTINTIRYTQKQVQSLDSANCGHWALRHIYLLERSYGNTPC